MARNTLAVRACRVYVLDANDRDSAGTLVKGIKNISISTNTTQVDVSDIEDDGWQAMENIGYGNTIEFTGNYLGEDGTGGTTAILKAIRSGANVVAVEVVDGGSGYTTAPTITFGGDAGSGATATAYISGGRVIAVDVTAGGSSYDSSVTATAGAPSAAPAVIANRDPGQQKLLDAANSTLGQSVVGLKLLAPNRAIIYNGNVTVMASPVGTTGGDQLGILGMSYTCTSNGMPTLA